MVDRFVYKFQDESKVKNEGEFLLYERTISGTGINIDGINYKEQTLKSNRSELAELIASAGFNAEYAKLMSTGLTAETGAKKKPRLMGIINATLDSFYPRSRNPGNFKLVDKLIDQKPDIIDIGGESTRPGSSSISVEEEISRVSGFVNYVASSSDIPVSIDTRNSQTAKAMVAHGASYINDITGFSDLGMRKVASESGVTCILMHMRGTPETMNSFVKYENIIAEIVGYFYQRLMSMQESGVSPGKIILDPGIGFAKDFEGNMRILKEINSFKLGFPILVGTSMKSWIGHLTGLPVEDRLPGTIASSLYLYLKGIDILRVHDVKENRSALEVFDALEHFT